MRLTLKNHFIPYKYVVCIASFLFSFIIFFPYFALYCCWDQQYALFYSVLPQFLRNKSHKNANANAKDELHRLNLLQFVQSVLVHT